MMARRLAVSVLAGMATICLSGIAFAQEAEPKKEKAAEHSPRWAIRNGLDPAAAALSHSPHVAPIGSLAKAARPAALPPDGRVKPTETTVWQVEGDLVRYEMHDDGDVQFVLREKNSGATLVCEIPDPEEVRHSPFLQEIRRTRQVFTRRFAPTKTTRVIAPKTVRLRVAGLGYFGRISQGGKPGLSNGVQLHPVTQLTVLPPARGEARRPAH